MTVPRAARPREKARREEAERLDVEILSAIGGGWEDPLTEDDFDRLFTAALKGGPSLIAVRIDNKPGTGTTDRDPVQIRARFMQGLGVDRGQ